MSAVIRLAVSGMTCGHCVQSVTKALEKVPGVEKAEVSREPGEAIVHGSADSQALIKAVVEEGYQAEVKG